MACAAPSKAQATVFLSHAGEQKKVLVDFLYNVLTEEGISVFMDEPSLVPGTSESRKSIVEALRLAAVGVPSALVFVCLFNMPAGSCSMPALCFALRKLCSADVECTVAFARCCSLPGQQSDTACLAVLQWWSCCRPSLCARHAPWRSWQSC